MPWHMDPLSVPGRFIIGIQTQSDPDVFGPLCSFLLRERVLDYEISVFQEELNLFV